MKKTLLFLAVIGLASALVSCAPQMTLFPLHTPEDKVFDEQILGEWRQVDPEEQKAQTSEAEKSESIWTFARGKDGLSYDVKVLWIKGKGNDGLLSTARIVKLGNFLFMDFQGRGEEDTNFGFYPFPVVNTHIIARIRADQRTLRFDFLSDDWITGRSKAGKPALATLDVEGQLLVTATTAELRSFALAHGEDTEAFSERYEFVRAK